MSQRITLDRRHAPATTAIGMMIWIAIWTGILGENLIAQDRGGESTRSNPDIRRAIEDLSRKDYSARQQATLEMWRDREQSRDAVQEAARSSDPETAGRAQWILRQWRLGSLPDTPPEISRLLRSGDQPSAIERLLEAGHFQAAVVAIEESAGTIDHESIQRRTSALVALRFPIYVRLALRSESLDQLLKLVDLIVDSNEMAVCRIDLMRALSIPITDENLLPRSALGWAPAVRELTMAMLLMKLGRDDDAIRIARQSGDEDLLLNCRMVAGRWRDIADDLSARAVQTEMGSLEHCLLWCRTLAAADRCADKSLFDQAVEQLDASEICDMPSAADARWKYLAGHGLIDRALAVLGPLSPDAAASLAMDSSRMDAAFDVLGYPVDRVDSEYRQWTDQALQAQREGDQESLTPEMRRLLVFIQCLLAIGRDDVAWPVAERLCSSDLRIGSTRTLRLAEYVMSTLSMTKRDDWISEFAVDPVDDSLSPGALSTLARTLPAADGTTLEIVTNTLSRMYPAATVRHHLESACQLLRGHVPAGFNPDTDFQRFFDIVTRPQTSRSFPGMQQSNLSIRANLDIVTMLSRLGRTDLAAECLTKLAQSGDTDAVLRMAQRAMDSGRIETARQLFELTYRTIRSRGRMGGGRDVELAGKALVGLWKLARRSGDTQLSEDFLIEIRLVLCSPSMQTRFALIDHLVEQNETDIAIEAYRELLPIKAIADDDSPDFYSVARGFSLAARQSHPLQAARWFDLAAIRSIPSDNFRPSAFVTLPIYVGRWSLEAAIAEQDESKADAQVDRLLQLDALDIDLAERLLPKMRDASMTELADQTFDRILQRGLAYTRSYPLDAMTRNNLAWVAAMNQKQLDVARRLSEKAVYLEPDSAIYRDTLAELLFLQGEKGAAISIEKACLLDDPKQWHLHQQIQRFSE